MTSPRALNLLGRFAYLVGSAAIVWAMVAACNALGLPRLKWVVIGAVLAMWAFVWLCNFGRGVNANLKVLEAYARRQIQTTELPSDFRFITHDTTLAEVTAKLGPASRVVELALQHRDGDTEHFMAHEYDLPYEAAVVVLPQRPFGLDDKIRAVSVRGRSYEDGLVAAARHSQ